jgi:fucose 4-O-acetylase-like acetyltransferase
LGPISILLDGLAGLLFVRLFLRLNRHRNAFVNFFEAIGRRSLYIFCVHTVELTAIPWYLFAAKYVDRPVLGICLQYILSLGSIWLVCALLQRRRDLVIKLFPARRHTPQVHYTPRH